MSRLLRALTAVSAAALLAGCAAPQPERPQLSVYAAASLTSSFAELTDAFAANHPHIDVLPPVFDGSSTLATQLVAGAPADVFASADLATMTLVDEAGLIVDDPQPLATNTLQIAVAPGNPHGIRGISDLSDSSLTVVLCAPQVPCGSAAQDLLADAGIELNPASEEQNVAAVATKVRLGEADAGLVYATDIQDAGAELHGVPIAGADRVVNHYVIGALSAGGPATEFIDWVLSDAGQAIMAGHGFGQP